MPKLTVQIEAFKPMRSNTLYGFVSIVIPEIHLRILELTVHQKGESRWVGMPGKPQITREGTVRKGDNGKLLYVPVVDFTDRETRDAFGQKVLAALLEAFPHVFEMLTETQENWRETRP